MPERPISVLYKKFLPLARISSLSFQDRIYFSSHSGCSGPVLWVFSATQTLSDGREGERSTSPSCWSSLSFSSTSFPTPYTPQGKWDHLLRHSPMSVSPSTQSSTSFFILPSDASRGESFCACVDACFGRSGSSRGHVSWWLCARPVVGTPQEDWGEFIRRSNGRQLTTRTNQKSFPMLHLRIDFVILENGRDLCKQLKYFRLKRQSKQRILDPSKRWILAQFICIKRRECNMKYVNPPCSYKLVLI